MLRLYQLSSPSGTTKFAYDGLDMIAEYNAAMLLQRRYVHGPGDDQPIVWYEGSGTTNRRFLSSDERGSLIGVTDSSGAVLATNTYDKYGIPGSSNLGRFQYTGQAWLSELGMSYYKARMYSATMGRFLQTDPIGYDGDGPNLYAYVLNDPVNLTDPLGLDDGTCGGNGCGPPIEICGNCTVGSGFSGSPYGGPGWARSKEPPEPRGPKEKGKEERINSKKLKQCFVKSFADYYGLTAGAGLSALLAIPISKSVVPPYRQIGARTTNLLSVLGHFVEVNVPRILESSNLFRIAGRANPYVAVGLAAIDIAAIGKATYDCYVSK
jgi:RHS repeat-associated protein